MQSVRAGATMADEVFVPKDGEIGHYSPAAELLKNEEVLEPYLGN